MKTVLIILPDSFSQRNFLESPLAEKLQELPEIKTILAGRETGLPAYQPDGKKKIYGLKAENDTGLNLKDKTRRRLVNFLNAALEFRFNSLKGFRHQLLKQKMDPEHIIDKRHDSFNWFIKWPCPKSKWLYRLFYRLYNANFLIDSWAKKILKQTNPDLLIVANCQKPLARNYVNSAKAKGIKIWGFINSWDHLTTDGPVLKGIDEFIGWNNKMIEELKTVQNNFKPAHNIGPIQMDNNFKKDYLLSEDELKDFCDLSPDKKIIVFGVYNKRLGEHEISIVDYLVKHKILETENAFLIVRGHPKDHGFNERYGNFLNCLNVALCQNGRLFTKAWQRELPDGQLLNSLLKNCSLTICGPTTLTLDALQFNKPVINIAFDGDLKLPPANSVKIRYQWEHYSPLLTYGAVYYVESYEELIEAFKESLDRPEKLLPHILKLKKDYLEPLDGRAAERLAGLIKRI